MEALTLFRLVCGPDWRFLDLVLCPAVELVGMARPVYHVFAQSHNFGAVASAVVVLPMILTGILCRLWVSRNRAVLEAFFRASGRRISALEIFLAVFYSSLFVWELSYTIHVARNHTLLAAAGDIVYNHLFASRYLWICYILALYLSEVNFQLKNRNSEEDLRSFKQNCELLESVNLRLNGLHDYIVYASSLVLIYLGSMAVFSRCEMELNMVTCVSHQLIPSVILIALGEQASREMYSKRVRIRRMWPTSPEALELHVVSGHKNALGLRWMALSRNMNFSSALPLLSSILAHVTLVLTTPIFHGTENFDIFCGNGESSR